MSDLSPENQLSIAISMRDHDTALKLLMDAGGACETRDFLKRAEIKSNHYIGHTLQLDGKRETITVGLDFTKSFYPLVSITKDACKR
jgi:hypothetical protein